LEKIKGGKGTLFPVKKREEGKKPGTRGEVRFGRRIGNPNHGTERTCTAGGEKKLDERKRDALSGSKGRQKNLWERRNQFDEPRKDIGEQAEKSGERRGKDGLAGRLGEMGERKKRTGDGIPKEETTGSLSADVGSTGEGEKIHDLRTAGRKKGRKPGKKDSFV